MKIIRNLMMVLIGINFLKFFEKNFKRRVNGVLDSRRFGNDTVSGNKIKGLALLGFKSGVVVISVILFSLIFISCGGKKSDKTPIEMVEVKRGDLSVTIQSTATISPENRLEIKPPLAGRAESVEVEIGDKVKQGQVLAWMSSSERAAMLDAARAKGEKELEYWKDIYKAAPLAAPLDGEIIARSLIPGQTVQATETVFVMSDRLIAQADVDETDLGRLKIGQDVEITLDGFPGEMLSGKILKIAYDSETVNNVTTYQVDIVLDEVPDFLRSGMTANVLFIVAKHENVLQIPLDAVKNGGTVFVEKKGEKSVRPKKIKTGIDDGRMVEVVDGLSEGEKIARSAYVGLQEKKEGFSILPKFPRRGRVKNKK